jgi:hypothetical protein
MDFINPEEKTREAKLDYGEPESLVRFLNFQRERRSESPISADQGQLCELLSETHPDVEFKLDGYRIVARVKDGAVGSLVDHIGFVSSNIPHLGATISFGSESFEVVFRADGIGVIKEECPYGTAAEHLFSYLYRGTARTPMDCVRCRAHLSGNAASLWNLSRWVPNIPASFVYVAYACFGNYTRQSANKIFDVLKSWFTAAFK